MGPLLKLGGFHGKTTVIPIDPSSFTDMEGTIQWVLDHDKEAQQIARNCHLWISKMVLHPMV
jgi:hypothetical protein